MARSSFPQTGGRSRHCGDRRSKRPRQRATESHLRQRRAGGPLESAMKLALLLLGVSLAYGQTAGVEGTVVSSSDGRPVKRAIVELRGIRSGRGPATETYLVEADSQG